VELKPFSWWQWHTPVAHQGISIDEYRVSGWVWGLTHEAHIPRRGDGLLVGLISGVTLFSTIETKGKGLAWVVVVVVADTGRASKRGLISDAPMFWMVTWLIKCDLDNRNIALLHLNREISKRVSGWPSPECRNVRIFVGLHHPWYPRTARHGNYVIFPLRVAFYSRDCLEDNAYSECEALHQAYIRSKDSSLSFLFRFLFIFD